jgi:hypothetical protein
MGLGVEWRMKKNFTGEKFYFQSIWKLEPNGIKKSNDLKAI